MVYYVIFWSLVVIIGAAIWHYNAKSNGHKSTYWDKFLKMILVWFIGLILGFCTHITGAFDEYDGPDYEDVGHSARPD